jgi:hypothetical protein
MPCITLDFGLGESHIHTDNLNNWPLAANRHAKVSAKPLHALCQSGNKNRFAGLPERKSFRSPHKVFEI